MATSGFHTHARQSRCHTAGEDAGPQYDGGGAKVIVVHKSLRSTPIALTVGMAEGTRLSSAFFVAGARSLAQALNKEPAGVGLDLPENAVIAYHLTRAPESSKPDVARVKQIVGQLHQVDGLRSRPSS